MSDYRPEQDKRPNEGGEDVKRQIKKRIAIAGALVAVALAAIPILNSLNKSKVETTASNPQSSSGRIVSPASSEPLGSISSAIESSAPATQASEPAHAAPGLPSTPATEKTPSVAASQITPPGAAAAPTSKPAGAGSPSMPPAAPPTTAPVKQAKPPVAAPTVAPAPVATPAPAPLVPRATPKAPPPVPVETAEPAVKGGSFGYNVQLGLFSSLDNALKLANALKAQGIPVKTETRVHVGPFRTRAEAEETMAKLKSLGYNPLLQAATQ